MIRTVSKIKDHRTAIRRVVLSGLTLCATFSLASCDKEPDFDRKQYLTVSETGNRNEPVSSLNLRLDENRDTIYVFSNVEYDCKFETSGLDKWVTVEDKGKDPRTGADIYWVNYEGLDESYERRVGSLNFSSPENYLGTFITVNQGLKTLWQDNFNWLNYGLAGYVDEGARRLDGWTAEQKNRGWVSSGDPAYLYGKVGMVRLGDEANGADMTMPQLSTIISDSVLMVRFFALAHVENSVKDGNKLKVSVLNGGIFTDGTTEKLLDVAYTDDDTSSAAIRELYVVDSEINPRTQLTRIQFSTLGLSAPNRVYIDNFFIHTLDESTLYLLEE